MNYFMCFLFLTSHELPDKVIRKTTAKEAVRDSILETKEEIASAQAVRNALHELNLAVPLYYSKPTTIRFYSSGSV